MEDKQREKDHYYKWTRALIIAHENAFLKEWTELKIDLKYAYETYDYERFMETAKRCRDLFKSKMEE